MVLLLVLFAAGCAGLAYRHMNDASRDAWQQPKAVVDALAISPGARVADLGAGGGYFTWPLARAVGPSGKVYAIEINETALQMLEDEVKARDMSNVEVLRATREDAGLPEPVDLVFLADTYHHMTNRAGYFRSAVRYLKPEGRVAIIDFHKKGFFSGLLGHGTSKQQVRDEMEHAGYRVVADHDFLEDQHYQIFSPTERPGTLQ